MPDGYDPTYLGDRNYRILYKIEQGQSIWGDMHFVCK